MFIFALDSKVSYHKIIISRKFVHLFDRKCVRITFKIQILRRGVMMSKALTKISVEDIVVANQMLKDVVGKNTSNKKMNDYPNVINAIFI